MDSQGNNCPFQYFRKRDGLLVPFREEKIANAIFKAGEAASRQSGSIFTRETAERIAHEVVKQLDNPNCEYYTLPDADGNRIPKLEDVQDMVEITLVENKMAETVAAYKRYRKIRERARAAIHVRSNKTEKDQQTDLTDQSLLLVKSATAGMLLTWDRTRIVHKLIDKLNMDEETANGIAKEVENQIISSNIKTVGTELIRELVNNILVERGYRDKLEDLSLYHISREFIEDLMNKKSKENSNIVCGTDPEAVGPRDDLLAGREARP